MANAMTTHDHSRANAHTQDVVWVLRRRDNDEHLLTTPDKQRAMQRAWRPFEGKVPANAPRFDRGRKTGQVKPIFELDPNVRVARQFNTGMGA